MHGTYDKRDSDGRTVSNTPGSGGSAKPQRPIPGPESTGGPPSMKKALARKGTASGKGVALPNRGTSAPGSR